jgi:CheY-like chemotaxis protein
MKKILIIEDDGVLGDVLMQKLQTFGFNAELVKDGAQGYARMKEWMPDLVLLDIFLPTLNGIEILNQKRTDAGLAAIPVIVLSNSLHPTEGTEIEKLGASAFMLKSNITTEVVMEIIQKTLSNASLDPKALEGKKVLLVEDDNFLGSILLSRLVSRNANVTLAKTGEEALEYLKKQVPHIVLLDILLPGINGFEVLESIRKTPETKNLPVIVISNFNQPKDQEKATELGAGLLVKALVNPDVIVDHVAKKLEEKE